jgi:Arc/MetJ family transcription regulator
MRTNIVIDDQLMADALKLSGLQTKREAVEEVNIRPPHRSFQGNL